MKRIFTILLSSAISLSMMSLLAQNPVKLWQNGPATDNGHDNEATITVFHPADSINTGMAVVVCPGGGYTHLAMDHEGMQVAKWLADNGITGVVLKYRLPHGNYTIPAEDAREALRTVRRNADKWKVNPAKVGIAGSSAGGHLASTVSTHITDAESRPDFSILFYPVVTSESGITHQGSIDNLLGDKSKDAALLAEYANEQHVDANTPPTIILLSDNDRAVLPENSIRYYRALKENKIPASMYIFPEGGHGWGFRPTFKYHEVVKTLLHEWLKDRNKTTEEAKK
ncbi:MAG: alpha/beta hydrolase [Muribaculaceae bacterium]|jgi:acetyl esterase/lipase|nr:alpha/beta hydrolase [Muribaculaceae bacterium]